MCYLKAAPEKWELYKANMGEAKMEFEAAMTTGEIINARYDKWVKIIERSALESIWTAKLNIENKEKFLERFEAIRDARS